MATSFDRIIASTNLLRIASTVLFAIAAIGCGPHYDDSPPRDPPVTKPTWVINWSYTVSVTEDNNLVSNVCHTTVADWLAVLRNGTEYTVSASFYTSEQVPDQTSLIYGDIPTFERFMRSFYLNVGGARDKISNSYLFGVFEPQNTDADVLGFTDELGKYTHLPPGQQNAVSYVLKQRIMEWEELTDCDQKFSGVDFVVLHELGHARGLRGNDNPEYDHNTHGGDYINDCVMHTRAYPALIITRPHVFCAKHKKIMRECLKEIKSSYTITATCANAPY
jgi:hypothetical protein